MKVSDYVTQFLASHAIDKVFGYVGGNNAHLLDSIDKHPDMEVINARHEQGAGFAAEGYARATGKTGVATVTSGPGGTNLVTPIASCFLDSVPSLFIVGDINSFERDPSKGMRQIGFQDVDIANIVKPITKHAIFIQDLHQLRYELEKAYYLSQEGRKGPTLIAIPVNLQYEQEYDPSQERSFFESDEYRSLQEKHPPAIEEATIQKVVQLIHNAKRPLILIGNGVRLSHSIEQLNQLLQTTQIPTVHSLIGKDAITADYPYNLGFIGSWGNRYGNLTLANADLILALGTRLDTLQTGRNIKSFARDATIVQVDIDPSELGKRISIDLPIFGDVQKFLKQLNCYELHTSIDAWHTKVLSYKEQYPHTSEINQKEKRGNQILSIISKHSKESDIFTIDVGEHQMLSAQSLQMKEGQRVLFTGGLGSMGFALPAAIGATLGTKQRAIVIAGDGGFQMNIQELEVIHHRQLPIKIFILNNACLYMVTQMQDIFLEGKHVATKEDYSAPNFHKIAEAYGLKTSKISADDTAIESTIQSALESNTSELIEIMITGEMMCVTPRLDYSRPFEDMSPYLDKEILQSHMNHKV
ncbi:MAG: thiamine pyrophosphate-binding protein [Hydrogenimonas sp.]|nr:MAG: thiamine pyrophosphate-binding protein [Hydrogenimonas sp.]